MNRVVVRVTLFLTRGHVDLEERAARKASHESALAREATEAREAAWDRARVQGRLDKLLPAFLTGGPVRPPVGTRWITLANLALGVDEDRQVGFIFDLAPSVHAVPYAVLPRGTTLRLLEPFSEMWGSGYCAGVFFDLAVEDGPLAGQTVTLGESAHVDWANGGPRRTLAAALIAPIDDPATHDGVLARARYDLLAQILDEGTRVAWSKPRQPVTRPADLAAFGIMAGEQ